MQPWAASPYAVGVDGGATTTGAATPVELTAKPDGSPPIACTLDGSDVAERIAAWRRMLRGAVARTPVGKAGLRIDFGADVDLEGLTALVAAELACCAFFTFDISLTPTTASLEVAAPDDAAEIVQELFGT